MAKSENNIEEAGMGHNSLSAKDLRGFLDRIGVLIDERDGINADIRLIMEEAKGKGFDVRTIREIIKIRRLDQTVREERKEMLDLYLTALGLM